jgi:hypothetical protein
MTPTGSAAVAGREPSRFDPYAIEEPVALLGVVAEAPDAIEGFEEGVARWRDFGSALGGSWKVWIDRRSGAPLLVEGSGVSWFDPQGPAPEIDALEGLARAFLSDHEITFRVRGGELELDREGTATVDGDRWVIAFRRAVEGVPVDGERFVLYVVRGNLVSFGAQRWGTVSRVPDAVFGVETTRQVLFDYMGIRSGDSVEEIESGSLLLSRAAPEGIADSRWIGPVGSGVSYRLVRRFVVRVAGEPGTWVGKVDAVTGEVVALYDDEKYAQAKGSVYPKAADQNCAEFGCLLPGYPMSYADLTVDGLPATANDMGMFEDCSAGSVSTALVGPYVRISDACGAVNETGICDQDLDLGGNAGTNCTVPAGRSAGDTNASRTGFWIVNRVKEKGRYWLPTNNWLKAQVQVNTNVNSTCNASWSGQLNMYRAGGGCRNTAETAGVLTHEYGHGLDQNDGGGYDNTSEGYADVVAILSDRASCVGRGFFESGTCSGYGDTCLTCTGIRDMDFAARQANTPATPANFTGPRCGGGSGPCGKETHCESYPPSEAIYDLATRDLPAAGLDPISAWQLTEKLFMKSRQGSGGPIFNCSLPNSDGCNAGGWYNTMRIADDDDGNLANGTPHAAAIYAAFARHAIACGSAGAPENQSTSSCPSLATPTLSASNGSNSVTLSWNAVPNASKYLILRSDVDCNETMNVIDEAPAPSTSYVDADLPNEFTVAYRIQAQGANSACESRVSACATGTPQPFAGSIKLDRPAYSCSGLMQITVRDANIGTPTTAITVWSTTENVPETVTLTETAPGSGKYVGSIPTTGAAPVPGDGDLSIADGDALNARYVDADDGQGGSNLERIATAAGDCRVPLISQVGAANVTDVRADIRWNSDESTTSIVRYGEVKPPSLTASVAGRSVSHSVPLTGLRSCTVYWYSVEGDDVAGNLAASDNGGQFHYFETLGDLGNGLQACHAGRVTTDKNVASCSDLLPLSLTDLDLNVSPTTVDSVTVTVTSSTEILPETVILTETGVNTSRFSGSIATSAGAPSAGDGILQVADGDVLTVTYQDSDDGTGATATSFDTAAADCADPNAPSIRVVNLTDESVQVQWSTNEPTTGSVDWGPTPSLGSTVTDNVLRTTHTLTLSPVAECGVGYFRITSADAYGNTRLFDAAGSPFTFHANRIPPGVFKDSFETTTGWTLEGEWQIGAPEGRGTPPADPAAPFEGTKILGHDLTGLGSRPGDYELNTTQRATTPAINASALTAGQIRFRRWLNVGDGAVATIKAVRNGQVFTVWTGQNASQSSWSLETINISTFSDGNPNLKLIFEMKGNSSGNTRSSWNIDRLVVNSANSPAFEACGGCAGAPTFAGAVRAYDPAPCADSGVVVEWNEAPAWGTGSSGTFAVYRSTDPSFIPSATNRIAVGVAGTSYHDASAPNDVALHYVVRAENNENCSTGPNNGGVVESNTVRVSGLDSVSQPTASPLGNALRLAPVNDAHVRLTWPIAAGAVEYRVYRAQTPLGPFSLLDGTTKTFFEDIDQMGNATSWYYDVRTVDACGNETP